VTTANRTPHYLLISAHHDYRTQRRSSIHFIADELAKRGTARFFSMRYSLLSKPKGDIRVELDSRANQVETWNGVECFLWKTPIHPFNLHSKLLQPLESLLFDLYRNLPCPTLDDWTRQADVIIYESGITPIHFDRAKRLNPHARHIYLCNDDLQTIDAADYAVRTLDRVAPQMDTVIVVARSMANSLPSTANAFFVPHGLDASLEALGDPNPYGPGNHAVSIGSMLFDVDFFVAASHAFPELTFHVIGSGHPHNARYGSNVEVYDHMPYDSTIRYIKHAHIGVAPYRAEHVPRYLADSSMKMMQYDFFGLPMVCPHSVTGDYSGRFGYTPGNPESVRIAIARALDAPHLRSRKILRWSEVTDRLLQPQTFADTRMHSGNMG
jgi:2-beta-glucuronyltransferase